MHGTGTGVEMRGLVFSTVPIRAGKETKIVWRVTGTGDLRLTATGPDGKDHAPVWGPEPHGGSSFERPGEEWGAGFTFGKAGCWRVHAERANGGADVWLKIG